MRKIDYKTASEFFNLEEWNKYLDERDELLQTNAIPNPITYPRVMMYEYHWTYGIERDELSLSEKGELIVSNVAKAKIASCQRFRVEYAREHQGAGGKNYRGGHFRALLLREMASFFLEDEMPDLLDEISELSRLGSASDSRTYPKLSLFYWHKKLGLSRDDIEYLQENGVGPYPWIYLREDPDLTLDRLFNPRFYENEIEFATRAEMEARIDVNRPQKR